MDRQAKPTRSYRPPRAWVSYYSTGTTKKVAAYENPKLASAFDPQNRDENIDYYVAKLDKLVKKFGVDTTASSQLASTQTAFNLS